MRKKGRKEKKKKRITSWEVLGGDLEMMKESAEGTIGEVHLTASAGSVFKGFKIFPLSSKVNQHATGNKVGTSGSSMA